MKKRVRGLLALALSLVMVLSLNAVTASAAGTHNCGKAVSDCLVCEVAELINALPTKDDITVNNAAKVTEQIHAIDRIKVDLTDDEYDELLTLVDTRHNQSGYGLDEPVRYMEALVKLSELNAGGSLYVAKSYSVGSAELNWAKTDAVISIECLDAGSSFAPLSVMLADIVESSLAGFYSTTADGWMNRYILPAGTYKITETGYHAVTKDGANLTTTATYEVDGNTTTDYAIVTVEEGSSSVVYTVNTYAPSLTVSNNAEAPDAEFFFTVTLKDPTSGEILTDIDGFYGDMSFTEGVATFTLGNNESVTATGIPEGTDYKVTTAQRTEYHELQYRDCYEGLIFGACTATFIFRSAITTYGVSIGDTQVTSANASDVLDDGTVSYDPDTSTLTLNGLDLEYATGDAISATGELTIKLISDNKVTSTSNGGTGVYVTGGDLTINCTGSLTVTGNAYGISADNVSITGGTVNAKAADNASGVGISASGDITINNASVDVGCAIGLEAGNNISINASTVTIDAKVQAISCTGLGLSGWQYQWTGNKTEPMKNVAFDLATYKTSPTAYLKFAPYTAPAQPPYNGSLYIPPVEEKPVTSAKTSDPIALSVAVTILSATGSAWLLRKKHD